MTVDITPDEAKVITDVIDIWVLGIAEAKELTTEDPTIDSAEQLLDLMSGYDDDLTLLHSVRQKLNARTQEEDCA